MASLPSASDSNFAGMRAGRSADGVGQLRLSQLFDSRAVNEVFGGPVRLMKKLSDVFAVRRASGRARFLFVRLAVTADVITCARRGSCKSRSSSGRDAKGKRGHPLVVLCASGAVLCLRVATLTACWRCCAARIAGFLGRFASKGHCLSLLEICPCFAEKFS